MHFQPIDHPEESHEVEGYVVAVPMEQSAQDPLDDVFGSDSPQEDSRHAPPEPLHMSDMRRLETDHTTAGYREGLTAAKASSVQAGFDEGFGLGAAVGQKAGHLLGLLEGMEEALRTSSESTAAQSQLAEAREDLAVEKLFSADYWAPDGNWKYEVAAAQGGDVLFEHVAAEHPLVRKWTAKVDGLVETYKVNLAIFDDDNEPRVETLGADQPAATSNSNTTASKQALDW